MSGGAFAVALLLVAVAAVGVSAAAAAGLPCPSASPCGACAPECRDWVCITIPEDGHYAAPADRLRLVELGYDALTTADTLSYRIVFHNNTVDYPTSKVAKVCTQHLCDDPYCPCTHWETKNVSFGTNQNKLFGFTRGIVPVMDKSCMFSWRRTLDELKEPPGLVRVYGYGWYDEHTKPWEHPAQNPDMGLLAPDHPYIFSLHKADTECVYTILDARTSALVANATTPQMPGGLADGDQFALFFGGEISATQAVTVSYTRDLDCTGALRQQEQQQQQQQQEEQE